jgi:ferric enterobactin receptor
MNLKVIPFLIILLLHPKISGAQSQKTNDIRGFVFDSQNGEPIPYVIVTVLGTQRRTVSNSDGYFVLVNEPVGEGNLIVQHIGYLSDTVNFENNSGDNQIKKIKMNLSTVVLEGVTIKAKADLIEVSTKEASLVSITPQYIKHLPGLGEPDIFRAIQLLPGVTGASEAESGLYVRGGTPDQNLILFDGMTIYHADHFFGFFSAFNSDAVKDIQLYKGGFPAQFGGRISSVVNMTGKTGNINKPQFGVSVNLLNANVLIELPLWHKGTFLFAARRSYTDFLRSNLYNDIYRLTTGDKPAAISGSGQGPGSQGGPPGGNMQNTEFQPDFYFYDLNSKVSLNIGTKDIIAVSLYSGKDNLDKSQDLSDLGLQDPNTDVSVKLETTDLSYWGNLGGSTKWARQWNNRIHTDFLLSSSKYFSTFNKDRVMSVIVESEDDTTGTGVGFASSSYENNVIKDLTGRLDVDWNLTASHTLKGGTWITRINSKFDYTIDDTISLLYKNNLATLTGFYLQDTWRLGHAEFTGGIRTSYYSNTSKLYWEPRFGFTIPVIPQLYVKGAWGLYYQFVNQIVNENVLEGSRDFWLLTDKNLHPLYSQHFILGLNYDLIDWLFSIEGYYKNMDNLVEFTRRLSNQADYSDYFFIGEGYSKGIEFLIQKKHGDISGWVNYTLSKVEHTFPSMNNGNPFPASNDRRHEAKAVVMYTLKSWTFSATTVFATGKAYTAPESQYSLEMLDGDTISYIHVGKKNSSRLPNYFRLDLNVSKQFTLKKMNIDIGLSIFNTTNHKNVWYKEYNLETVPVTVSDALMLGITPTFYIKLLTK